MNMTWIEALREFFQRIEAPLSVILNANGCREGWIQGELFRHFRPTDATFKVNCSHASNRIKHDIVCGRPVSLVAEMKVYGLHGYLEKNLYGGNLAAYQPPSEDHRIPVTLDTILKLQPTPGSYLNHVRRLSLTADVSERLMILVLQKAATIDRFGRGFLPSKCRNGNTRSISGNSSFGFLSCEGCYPMTPAALYLVDQGTPAFDAARTTVDVVCLGDSLTGWNNYGPARTWPYPTYPQFLQELCVPLGLRIANGGIAGEISDNGPQQVQDYLRLFPNARYFVMGIGTNDLGMSHDTEATSKKIIDNLDKMIRAVWKSRKYPILFNVPAVNESMFVPAVAKELRAKRDDHNAKLKEFCDGQGIPLADIVQGSAMNILPTNCIPMPKVRR